MNLIFYKTNPENNVRLRYIGVSERTVFKICRQASCRIAVKSVTPVKKGDKKSKNRKIFMK